jgi:hypothetical protein
MAIEKSIHNQITCAPNECKHGIRVGVDEIDGGIGYRYSRMRKRFLQGSNGDSTHTPTPLGRTLGL